MGFWERLKSAYFSRNCAQQQREKHEARSGEREARGRGGSKTFILIFGIATRAPKIKGWGGFPDGV